MLCLKPMKAAKVYWNSVPWFILIERILVVSVIFIGFRRFLASFKLITLYTGIPIILIRGTCDDLWAGHTSGPELVQDVLHQGCASGDSDSEILELLFYFHFLFPKLTSVHFWWQLNVVHYSQVNGIFCRLYEFANGLGLGWLGVN